MNEVDAPARGTVRGLIDRNTVRCECGHTEAITDHGTYRVVPTGRYRWRTNPATSEVWQEDEYRYICHPCWVALPEQ